MMGGATADFLRTCRQPGSALPTLLADAPMPPEFTDVFGPRLFARPFFLAESTAHKMADDLITLFDLLVSLPDRLFDGDLDRYAAAIAIDPDVVPMLRRLGGGRPPLFGRADLYFDGEKFVLLEFNIGSQVGLFELSDLGATAMRMPALAPLRERWNLRCLDTVAVTAAELRSAARASCDRPTVGLVQATGGLALFPGHFESIRSALGRHGVEVVLGELTDIELRNSAVSLRGRRIDVVYRYFGVDQLREQSADREQFELLCAAVEAGNVGMFTPMESYLFNNKAALGLLSDVRMRPFLSRTERAVIDQLLPWTRMLADTILDEHGVPVDMQTFCRHQREELLLKPSDQGGGAGVVPGWQVSDAEWRTLLAERAGTRYVVQRRVRPIVEQAIDPQTGEVAEYLPIWGVFVSEHGFAGAMVRAAPPESADIISFSSNPSTRVAPVLTVGVD